MDFYHPGLQGDQDKEESPNIPISVSDSNIDPNPYSDLNVDIVDNRYKLRFLYTNLDGIKNKVDEFHDRVALGKPHIICITETKLKSGEPTSDVFRHKDYLAYRKDRLVIRKKDAGGVLIFIRDFIVSEQVINQEWENIEIIVCRLLFGCKSVILACMYRPPSSPSNL